MLLNTLYLSLYSIFFLEITTKNPKVTNCNTKWIRLIKIYLFVVNVIFKLGHRLTYCCDHCSFTAVCQPIRGCVPNLLGNQSSPMYTLCGITSVTTNSTQSNFLNPNASIVSDSWHRISKLSKWPIRLCTNQYVNFQLRSERPVKCPRHE